MIREAIAALVNERRDLTEEEAAAAMREVFAREATPAQLAAFLVALRLKGETVDEVVGMARVMREHSLHVKVKGPLLDTCGTGGDGAGTFNVSTAAALVVAGAGVPVAKHGNRAASGRTGSLDVLEALGVRGDLPISTAARILAQEGIAFFYARRAHPAMRFVAPVREELGIRTLMNALGPLLNPVGARRQLVGVYAAELVEPLAAALGELGAERALVVHGEDGLDEITTTAPTRAALWNGKRLERMRIAPLALGLPRAEAGALLGGDAATNADIARAVLGGERGPRRDLVLVNAAGALFAAGAARDLGEGLEQAARSLDSGAASARLEALVRATRAAE